MTEHPVEDAVGHYKPEGTLLLMAGIVNAFPSRNVPSYFIVGFPLLDDGKINYVAMAAKSGNKTMIVMVPTTGVAIPTDYEPSEFMQMYREQHLNWKPQWAGHIAEITEGCIYNVFGEDLLLDSIQMVPSPTDGKVCCRLDFTRGIINV